MIVTVEKHLGNTPYSKLADTYIKKLKKQPHISPEEMITIYTVIFQAKFKGYLESVVQSKDVDFKENFRLNASHNHKLLNVLTSENTPLIEAFAEAKYLLDRMFIEVTNKGNLKYVYNQEQLLTSQQLEKEMNISRSTVNRYVQRGMETVETSSRIKFPLHNTYYWTKGTWITRLQVLNQAYMLRSRTKEDIVNDLKAEIQKFEKIYGKTFEEMNLTIEHSDDLVNPFDRTEWRHLVEELKKYSAN